MQQKIDMAENLKYLLTPVPLWLCHVDGSVNSNLKSNLLNHFDSQFVTFLPWSIDATEIDAAFFLYLQVNPPDTFREIAGSILDHIIGYSGNAIHLLQVNGWLPQLKI